MVRRFRYVTFFNRISFWVHSQLSIRNKVVKENLKMNKLLSTCPVCNGALKITTLQCSDCGMELKNEFQPGPFERLDQEQYDFLITFLSCQGNLKALQEELGISYPLAKKKLNDLLLTLEIGELKNKIDEEKNTEWSVDTMSKKASDIIKNKLFEEGGSAVIPLVRKNCRIFGNNKEFGSDSLGNFTFPYEIFDLITDHLLANGGKANKGFGRNARIGDEKCELDTLAALIGTKHFHRSVGEYTFDPVFVLAAMMEWAGIAYNKRGYVELTAGYKLLLEEK